MSATLESDTSSTLECLASLLTDLRALRHVAFRLWDGTVWPDAERRDATFVLKHPGSLHEMMAAGTAIGMAEAYLRDEFDVEGNMEAAVAFAVELGEQPRSWRTSLSIFNHLRRLPSSGGPKARRRFLGGHGRLHSIGRDQRAVSFHYDVSNDFYRLWLDERMVYSCAYFRSRDDSLTAAQESKLDYICRKLRLHPGQHLLDIGCGWGALAQFAAKFYGVRVTGVSLSAAQVSLARQMVRAAGLERDVTIEQQDYRELDSPGAFDAIVSVGMAEHVGRENLPGYFQRAWTLLRPGGVFLNHAIAEGNDPERFHGPSFVDAYVFPDADTPPLLLSLRAATDAGFEIRDVENLREHYTLTLRHWVDRLEEAHDAALRFVDEPTYRIWRLYLAGSAHGFDHGHLAIYQSLLAKPTESGRVLLPLTRQDWYR